MKFYTQNIPTIPEVNGDNVVPIYVWIITILVLAIIALITMYEKKLNKVTDRLNEVIDDSITRMEKKSDTEQSAIKRFNDLLVQLKEIVVIASR